MKDTKICKKCGRELPLTEFHKNKTRKDGLDCQCKECRKQYYQANKKEKLEYQNQYNAEHAEEIAEYFKQYYAEHAEYFKQYKKQYRAEHAEEIKQYKKQYRAEHAEYLKQWRAERYATIEGYAYNVRHHNLREDRKYGRCGKDEDILPPLEYYVWALQQRDFYDGKHYPFTEMGLDRIYNDKPHTFANVVPCSTKNNIRRQKMPFEEFKALMQKEKEELNKEKQRKEQVESALQNAFN